ncbi:MAG: hypothetical protein COA65_06475 [Rhodospirillaceae bacterium]|nr:MAG: hypothetical protein COA65_06475 [Rhodospirillaceae bacterium]
MDKKNKKRILYGIFAAVFSLIFLALIVPSFIDANQYKNLIADEVRSATGRALTIEGDIDLTILPAPAVSIYKIKFANLEGGASPDMAQIAVLRVRIALFPLFTGRIQVESISVIDPVIALEKLADGRVNWEFAPQAGEGAVGQEATATSTAAPTEKTADTGAAANAIQIDQFTIENGTLIYRDAKSGVLERIEKFNATIRAKSLVGPFHVDGGLVVRGMPLSLRLGTGRLVEGPGTPINLEIAIEDGAGGATLAFSGTLSSPNPMGVLTGTLMAKSENLAAVIGRFGVARNAPLPGFVAQEFSYESLLVASASNFELREIMLGFGDATAKGGVKLRLGKTVDAEVNVQATTIDFDRWLAMKPQDARERETVTETVLPRGAGAPSQAARKKDAEKTAFVLPKDINASFNFAVDSILFNGAAIRKAHIYASLGDGELTIDQATAQFPGGASLSMFGFVSAVKDAPHFEGDLDFRSENLRSLLNWLRVDIADVPANRMRGASLTAKLAVTPARVTLKKLKLKLDESQMTGTLSMAFSGRPDVRGNLSLNRLNLDAYLGKEKKLSRTSTRAAGAKATGAKAVAATPAKKSSGGSGKEKEALSALKGLEDFDADLSFSLDRLVFQKQAISGIRLSGALAKGVLTLRDASVRDLAGTRAKLSGRASKFSDTPQFDVHLDLRSKDVSRLFRLTGDAPPPAAEKLGATTLKARLTGGLNRLKITADLGVAKGFVRVSGDVGNLLEAPDFNLHLAVEHKNLVSLLQVFDYRPKSAKLGALSLKARMEGTAASVAFSGIDGRIGPVKIAGKMGARLDGPRPVITARLEAGEIPVHRFLPAARTRAASSAVPRKGGPAPRQGGKGSASHWSKAPLDLSGLRLVDATIDLSAAVLVYDNLRVKNPRLGVALKDGVLELSKLSGSLFGGTFDAMASLADHKPATVNGKLVVRGANIKKALFASSGFDLGDGNLDFDVDLKASGNSEHALVSALHGLADLRVKDGVAKGFDLDAVSARLNNLNSPAAFLGLLDSALSGGETRFQELRGKVRVANGIAKMEDMRMQAKSGTADLSGKVDLPNWNMDLRADFHLASEPGAPVFAMLLRGPLDAPHRRFDTKQFQNHLLKKGVGSLLKKILPFKKKTPEASTNGETEGGKETAPLPDPEKIIKDLFKGFGF